jgi:hypothetical protein
MEAVSTAISGGIKDPVGAPPAEHGGCGTGLVNARGED